MKKFYVGLLVLSFLCLLGFYVYGDDLYALNKPRVRTVSPSRFVGYDEIMLPHEALYRGTDGDFVFVLESEQGFSRTILTASRVEVQIISEDDGQGRVTLEPNSRIISVGRVIVLTDQYLEDGMRVVLYF